MKYPLSFILNGQPVHVEVECTSSLLDVLRNQLYLNGTKKGCDTGDCGACTVLLNGKAINSCITLALTIEGNEITTIEGLGNLNNPHPLQKAFHEHAGTQCGFCTPGMIMSAKAILDKNSDPTRQEIIEGISGNLCRCTGYVKIIDAIMDVATAGTKQNNQMKGG